MKINLARVERPSLLSLLRVERELKRAITRVEKAASDVLHGAQFFSPPPSSTTGRNLHTKATATINALSAERRSLTKKKQSPQTSCFRAPSRSARSGTETSCFFHALARVLPQAPPRLLIFCARFARRSSRFLGAAPKVASCGCCSAASQRRCSSLASAPAAGDLLRSVFRRGRKRGRKPPAIAGRSEARECRGRLALSPKTLYGPARRPRKLGRNFTRSAHPKFRLRAEERSD